MKVSEVIWERKYFGTLTNSVIKSAQNADNILSLLFESCSLYNSIKVYLKHFKEQLAYTDGGHFKSASKKSSSPLNDSIQ